MCTSAINISDFREQMENVSKGKNGANVLIYDYKYCLEQLQKYKILLLFGSLRYVHSKKGNETT